MQKRCTAIAAAKTAPVAHFSTKWRFLRELGGRSVSISIKAVVLTLASTWAVTAPNMAHTSHGRLLVRPSIKSDAVPSAECAKKKTAIAEATSALSRRSFSAGVLARLIAESSLPRSRPVRRTRSLPPCTLREPGIPDPTTPDCCDHSGVRMPWRPLPSIWPIIIAAVPFAYSREGTAASLFGYLAMQPSCFAAAILHETIRLRQLVRNRFSAARIAQLHVRHLLRTQHPPAFLAARKFERAVPDGTSLGVLHERDAVRGTNVCAAQTPNAIVACRAVGGVYLLVDAAVDRGDGTCSHAFARLHAQSAQDALTRVQRLEALGCSDIHCFGGIILRNTHEQGAACSCFAVSRRPMGFEW